MSTIEPEVLGEPQEGSEPRVVTAGVRRILLRVVRPDDEGSGESVKMLAGKAHTSTRTVYRILSEDNPTISLDLADRLVMAADSHLSECQLSWPDGSVSNYW